MANVYCEQAQKFLDDTNTNLTAVYDCELKQADVWGDKQNKLITRRYKVTLERNRRKYTFDYYTNHIDAEMLKLFDIDKKEFDDSFNYNVLSCLKLDYSVDFEDFCDNYGYDTDSIRAEKAWLKTLEQNQALRAMYSAEELEQLNDIIN